MKLIKTLEWAKGVMFSPSKNTKKTFKYSDAIRTLLTLSIVPIVGYILLFALGGVQYIGVDGLFGADPIVQFGFFLVIYILSIAFSPFVDAAVTHFLGKLVFRLMKKDYSRTYNATFYELVPTILLGWIPFIGAVVGSIWSIVIFIHALSNQQGITKKMAILVWLLPVIVSLVIAFVIAVLFGFSALEPVA